MFHPNFNYFIKRDNREAVPLINQKKIEIIIEIFIVILSLIIIINATIQIFTYENIIALGKMFWGLLTPGQQWIEILTMILGIGILLLIKLITDEFTEKVIKKIEYLEQKNAKNVKKIFRLEEENASNFRSIDYRLSQGKIFKR
jgi:hypothetical protein